MSAMSAMSEKIGRYSSFVNQALLFLVCEESELRVGTRSAIPQSRAMSDSSTAFQLANVLVLYFVLGIRVLL
jgi:hypothetical protein